MTPKIRHNISVGIFTAKIANQSNLLKIYIKKFFVAIYNKCKMLTHFYNVKQYLHLLPLHEQMTEINKLIDYYSNLNRACYNVKKRFSQIEQLKNSKRSIIVNYVARLRDDIHPCDYI